MARSDNLSHNHMNTTPCRTAVAFLFFSSGKDWQGGKNYYRSLFGALDSDADCTINVHAFFGTRATPSEFDFPSSVTCVRSAALDRGSPAWFFDKICKRLLGRAPLLRRVLKRHGIQVVSHCDPRDSGDLPSISWLTDFQHVHLPHFFQPKELKDRDAQFRMILAQADRVIVSSRDAYGDLSQFSPIHAKKARVLQFCAVQPEVRSQDNEDVECLYGLKTPFFYLPNQFWAHKNHRLAIEALATQRKHWPDVQIVCSGALTDYRNPNHIDGLKQRIADLGLQDHFKLLGLIPYHHIAQLMVRSAAVINPSYFEGWSTTVEEAKSLGAPLLLSDIKVHREQCTDKEALFFDPDDSNALITCMKQVLCGAWPNENRNKRLADSLERHHSRVIEMARTYQAIVDELVDTDVKHHA